MTIEAVDAARTTLEQEAEMLISQLHDVASGAVKSSERMFRRVEGRIEERPVGSVLTSLGVGIALGCMGYSALSCLLGRRK